MFELDAVSDLGARWLMGVTRPFVVFQHPGHVSKVPSITSAGARWENGSMRYLLWLHLVGDNEALRIIN